MENNREVDVNVLVQLYNQRLSTLTNQNILLEAKIQTLTQDFGEERKKLIEQNVELQKIYDEQNEDKYQKKGKD